MANESSNDNASPPSLPRQRCCPRSEKHVYTFVPQPGMTVDELAASVELLMFGVVAMIHRASSTICDQVYAAMDEKTQRHWTVGDAPKVKVAQKPPPGLHLPPGAKG